MRTVSVRDRDPNRSRWVPVGWPRARYPGRRKAPVRATTPPGAPGHGRRYVAVYWTSLFQQVGGYSREGRLQLNRVNDQTAAKHAAGTWHVNQGGREQTAGK